VLLRVVMQSLLVVLTLRHESSRAQGQVEAAAVQAAADIKQMLGRDLQNLQSLLWNDPSPPQWLFDAAELLRNRRELLRIEMRNPPRAGAGCMPDAGDRVPLHAGADAEPADGPRPEAGPARLVAAPDSTLP
jgi:hypothetical protein